MRLSSSLLPLISALVSLAVPYEHSPLPGSLDLPGSAHDITKRTPEPDRFEPPQFESDSGPELGLGRETETTDEEMAARMAARGDDRQAERYAEEARLRALGEI